MLTKNNKYTIIAVILGAASVLAARHWDYDVWEVLGNALNAFDLVMGHEIIFFGFLVTIGFAIDSHNRRKCHRHFKELAEERLLAMKATMMTVNDIVNNALNSLLIFRMEAQKHSSFPSDSIQQFDDIIFNTTERLKAIQNSNVFVSFEISEGWEGIKEN